MSPPRKAQVQPAKGSAPQRQNTTGRIVNKTQPQTAKQAPSNPNASNYNDELKDYLDGVKTPEQVKSQWGEVQKAKAAAEAAGDGPGAMAAKDALAGLQDKANGLGMSVKDLPTAKMSPQTAMKVAEAMAARSREEPAGKAFVGWASKIIGKKPAPTAAPKSTPPASAAPKAAKGTQGGYSKARVKQEPHKDCGKKVPYKDTKSVKGTGLQKDHTPSSKAIYTAAMEKLKPLIEAGDLSKKQAESIATQATKNAPTIAIPADVHRDGNTYGSKNKKLYDDQKLYEHDAKDLNGAAKRDTQKISETMADKKHGCNDAYNKAAEEITSMDWNKYVDDSIKQGMKGI